MLNLDYLNTLKNCNLCYRKCGVNRLDGQLGYCKSSDKIKIALCSLHKWEEPCISGENGSGTVFFSNCNLSCVFCQNHDISQEGKGVEVTIERLSDIFIELQNKNANNINLVTPTHYVPQIIEAIKLAKEKGLSIPILYNTNGYDTIETLNLLNGFIDVYLPDFKYFNQKYALKYSKATNYSNNVLNTITEMVNQVGDPVFSEKGIIQKGVIVRHLMLPHLLFDTKKILDTLHEKFGDKIYISLMNQYTPMHKSNLYPEINKPLNPKMYDSMIDYALEIGIEKAFIQESGTNTTDFVPDFNLEGTNVNVVATNSP